MTGTRREARLTPRLLHQLVAEHLTLSEIATRVDRSPGTVGHWLRRYGPSTTRAARTKDRRQSADSRFTTLCRRHGRTEFVIRGDGTSCCVKCRSAAVVAWRRGVKQRLIAEAGGGCTLCGYSRCAAALQFHHRDPDAKAFGIGSRGLGRSWEALVAEAAKCALLCANCHAEVEAGVATLR